MSDGQTSFILGSCLRDINEIELTEQKNRPAGITILVVLQTIGAAFALLGGLALLGIAGIATLRPVIEMVLVLVGTLLTGMGAINLFLAYGLWSGRAWAWTWALIFNVFSIVLGIFSLTRGHLWNIISLLLHVLTIVYLNTAHVKAFFGKA